MATFIIIKNYLEKEKFISRVCFELWSNFWYFSRYKGLFVEFVCERTSFI